MEGDVSALTLERGGKRDLDLFVGLDLFTVLRDEDIVSAHFAVFVIVLSFKKGDDFLPLFSGRLDQVGDERRTFFKPAAFKQRAQLVLQLHRCLAAARKRKAQRNAQHNDAYHG